MKLIELKQRKRQVLVKYFKAYDKEDLNTLKEAKYILSLLDTAILFKESQLAIRGGKIK